MFMKAWLLGMSHQSRTEDFADIPIDFDFDMPYESAMEFARKRISVTPSQFRKLSDDMKMRAFTVGRLSQIDMIGKVKQAYIKQLRSSSLSIDEFVKEALDLTGDDAKFSSYYELVFRINIQTAYNAAKAMEMMADPPIFLEFIGIEDERQSDICAACSGVILPYTDPWWDTHWPPLHYNCRSTIREIFQEEADARGLLDGGYNTNEELMRLGNIKNPQGSFGKNPARNNAFWATTPSQQNRVVKSLIQEELNDVAGRTICRDFKESKKGFSYEQTERGGIRYDDRLKKESEFVGNLEMSRMLAEKEGYFVELRQRELIPNNRQFDAWLNGMEKAEYKDLKTKKIETLTKEVKKASEQAPNIILRIMQNGQIRTLTNVIVNNGEFLANTRDVKQIKIMNGDMIVTLSNSDLRTPEQIRRKMSWLYNNKD